MAILYRIDGKQETVRPVNGRAFSLEEMQVLVGGYIQIVKANEPGMWIVCDEDGKVFHKPVNVVATSLWVGKDSGDPLVGEVLVGTGEEIGFPEEEQKAFENAFPGVDMGGPFVVFTLEGDETTIEKLAEFFREEAREAWRTRNERDWN